VDLLEFVSQPGLHSEFKASKGYMVRLCLKKKGRKEGRKKERRKKKKGGREEGKKGENPGVKHALCSC